MCPGLGGCGREDLPMCPCRLGITSLLTGGRRSLMRVFGGVLAAIGVKFNFWVIPSIPWGKCAVSCGKLQGASAWM